MNTIDTKGNFYPELQQQLKSLIADEPDTIANLANISALLYHGLAEVNWVGFYLLKGDELVLGPFQGKPACVRIPIGKGVCGTAAEKRETVLVGDVHEFPGHIACDINSQSEIVLPLLVGGELLGVLDIDSPTINRFSDIDRRELEKIVDLITSHLNSST